jgi:hypothetical protein
VLINLTLENFPGIIDLTQVEAQQLRLDQPLRTPSQGADFAFRAMIPQKKKKKLLKLLVGHLCLLGIRFWRHLLWLPRIFPLKRNYTLGGLTRDSRPTWSGRFTLSKQASKKMPTVSS